jgi:hypothetical protein
MRKWRPPIVTVSDECKMTWQIVVQEEYMKAVVSLDIGNFLLAEYKTRRSRELLIL